MQRSPMPRDSAESVTLSLMYPAAAAVGIAVGALLAAPIVGLAWRVLRWAAGW